MNPIALGLGLASFSACLISHILIWRSARPKNDMGALFAIFWAIPAAAFILYLLLSFAFPIPFSFDVWFATLVFHLAVSAAYIQNYPPAQVPAPTLKFVLLFASA